MSTHDAIRAHLLRHVFPERAPSLQELSNSEWSPEFERLMRNRLIMGALRYGPLGATGKPRYDRVSMIRERLEKYVETGNLEWLVDVANGALLEYVEGDHPLRHHNNEVSTAKAATK